MLVVIRKTAQEALAENKRNINSVILEYKVVYKPGD